VRLANAIPDNGERSRLRIPVKGNQGRTDCMTRGFAVRLAGAAIAE